MKRLHWYMMKSFAGPFVATFFISMFVLIMQFLWLHIDDLVGKGLEWTVIAQLLFYASMTLVPLGIPLAVLLASIMTFGNLGENYELTALKSAGISLYRIMKPLIFFIVTLTVLAFYFSNNVLPYANLKTGTLFYDIRQHKPEVSLKPGVFINDIDNYSILINRKNNETGMMYGLQVYAHTEVQDNNYEVTIADSGVMEIGHGGTYMKVELFNGYTYTDEGLKNPRSRTFPFRTVQFEKQYLLIPMEGNEFQRSDEGMYKNSYKMLNIARLTAKSDSLEKILRVDQKEHVNNLLSYNYLRNGARGRIQDSLLVKEVQGRTLSLDSLYATFDIGERKIVASNAARFARDVQQAGMSGAISMQYREKNIRYYNIEWHRKFSLSFACFIFFFIGAPLGGIIRKGGLGMPVVVSVLLFIVYHVISMMGERSAREVIDPALGMWISSLILLPLGGILTYMSMTDSAVMSAESYVLFLKKARRFLKSLFPLKKKNVHE
ncbi:MAG: LptF/LptG family permease [Odoribacteraceae bacterium]|jgi:lipopolysaccharide export system permease protein|nr:LptF/LptG family permease [Odoribacteraceae bacterium]